MKIKTSELTGRALDWAVALAQGWQKMADYNGYSTPNGVVIVPEYAPSWDWEVCGQLIEVYKIGLCPVMGGSYCAGLSLTTSTGDYMNIDMYGDTPQIAICRAVVTAQLGNEVEIPDELVEKSQS
ncbi:phage protein NinX family protein [Xenorhabdus sp. PB62.4]|uniref:phage protein NinX family protein n=1 Tax=Xenorhabdus sp. PB62.4 TaxID=1851573 RepID=UPI0016571FAC|nr:phage protein NinX family protein [Xenorhabdus sp. PB62.4]MBC8955015.1 hypothetical protein [Xenorhabdus sp. PB62.4]